MQQCRLFFRNSLWHLTKQTHINLSVFTKEWLWFLLGVQNAACELASVVWNCCASLDVAGDPQQLLWVCSCQQVKDLTRTHKPFKHETMNQSVAKASQFDRRLLRLGSFTWRSNFSSVVRVDGEDVVSVANFAKNKTTSKLVHCVVRLLVQNKTVFWLHLFSRLSLEISKVLSVIGFRSVAVQLCCVERLRTMTGRSFLHK